MYDANQAYLDLQLRYQHRLRFYASKVLGRSIELVSYSDRELLGLMRRTLPVDRRAKFDFAAEDYLSLMDRLRRFRAKQLKGVWDDAREELKKFSYATQEKEEERTLAVLPVRLELRRLSAAELLLVLSMPFGGGVVDARTYDQWLDSIQRADFDRIQGAVQSGISEGISNDEILKRLSGTRLNKYTDGVLASTRRNVSAILSAGLTHVHNGVSGLLWDKNPGIYRYLQWVSVLDGLTSAICRARDGKFAPIGDNVLPAGLPRLDPPGARPPAHPNCRSSVVPVFSEKGISELMGDRPYVRETRRGEWAQKNFREEAKLSVGERAWSKMRPEERQRLIDSRREAWLKPRIGTVPSDITYDSWLRGQPTSFQNEVLGVKKAALFRRGLRIDRFVDRSGRELSLSELQKLLE